VFDTIRDLCAIDGPVGQERAVLDYIEPIWQSLGLETSRSRIGNLRGQAHGQGPKLLLVAHADELCYLVRSIDPAGFLWLANGQNWDRATSFRNWFTVGQRVRVLARSGVIPGVIGAATGHLASQALPEPTELTWNDFWVDTGLSRDELLAQGVTPGTRIVWESPTAQFGPHIVGKALDDRAPLAVITEVIRRVESPERAWDITLACTVQEEIGLVGAAALGAGERFDAAIAVEIGMAGDIPAIDQRAMPLRLGGGPVLVHKDSMVHYDHALSMRLEQVAGQAAIPIQHAVFGSFGSDGAALMRADIPTALVAFPTRYTHSPFETAHLGDIEALVGWLCAFVRSAP
jgi:putative aminopeptidase FrvX